MRRMGAWSSMIRILFFMGYADRSEHGKALRRKPSYQGRIGAGTAVWLIQRMNASRAHLLRKSFAAVERQREVAALVFYQRLFELAPGVRPLFKTDILVQSQKLMDMLAVALSLLERPAELASELEQLGARHVGYGARPEHYGTVRRALLDMFVSVMANQFTPEMREAWEDLFDFIEAAMLRGAASVPQESGPLQKRS